MDTGHSTKEKIGKADRLEVEVLKNLVREEVEAQIRKEQQLLRDSASIAAKIVGAAIALFLAIFTIFGITTWSDIKKEAIAVVRSQTEELIAKSDSEASVKDKLTSLVNRAVIASHLTQKAKTPAEQVVLAENDWERLRSWLKSENLPLQDFQDALAVLNAQDSERKAEDSNRLLMEMLSPNEKSPYNWINKQPEKRAAILAVFKDRSLGPSAVEVVESEAMPQLIRERAATYVREVGFSEGVDHLLEIYARLKDGAAKRSALIACLVLRPEHPGVLEAFKKIFTSPATSHGVLLTAKAITVLPDLEEKSLSTADQALFEGFAKDLFRFAVRNGIRIDFLARHDSGVGASNKMADGEPLARLPIFVLWISTSTSNSSDLGQLRVEQFSRLKSYWNLLADSFNAGDFDTTTALLPQDRVFPLPGLVIRNEYGVAIKAAPPAKLVVSEDGTAQVQVDVNGLKDVTISNHEHLKQGKLRLNWVDEEGRERDGEIKSLKGSGYTFSLRKER